MYRRKHKLLLFWGEVIPKCVLPNVIKVYKFIIYISVDTNKAYATFGMEFSFTVLE
jgi:hypothetical protein